MNKTWWKEGIMYQIYPRSFNDSNEDGIGDLNGIAEKLDYIKDLGVDIIWLSPVYKSPNDDNGYDISDYYDIMDEFGKMADFDKLLEGVHKRGMKLVMDLVVNHSSDEHEWFQTSRSSKDNPFRDYYYWKPPGPDGGPPNNWQSFFGGSAWELDETTGEYYLHLFTKKQPDLNWENPKVREEVYQLMRFWLDKGVDGFRMDVIPLISKHLDFPDVSNDDFLYVIEKVYANGPRVHEFLREMNEKVISQYDMMTVGEGPGITSKLARNYVGDDRKELHMIFHLDHMFLGMQENGKFYPREVKLSEFKSIFTEWNFDIGEDCWINIYLDNHDFPRMVSRWGDDEEFHNESGKLLAMLILTLRGTPCIYQGSEIGMTNVAFDSIEDYRDVETLNNYRIEKAAGKDMETFMKGVHQNGRDNVRTPIQWDDSENGGFTTGKPWIKVNPNYKTINAKQALADSNSIYYFYQEMIKYRKANPTLVYGDYMIMDKDDEYLFTYRRRDDEHTYWIILNMSSNHQLFELPVYEELSLEICNYKDVNPNSRKLQPWEARLYKIKK
ncbi:MAG: alpha-glucosidase [Bacteroidota bacterium]